MPTVLRKMKLPALVIIAIFLLLHVSAVVKGVRGALALCAFSIIPSLFVFLVLSDYITTAILSEENTKISAKWIVWGLGALCGFPVGAVVCERLCDSGLIRPKDAARLLSMCNNASPAFVIGAVGNAMLGDEKLGVLIFFAQLFISWIMILPIRIYNLSSNACPDGIPRAYGFFSSVEKAIQNILKICGFICLFSAFLEVFRIYCNAEVYMLISILLEIGNGTANVSTADIPAQIVTLCGFACGWSGICVHMQIFSILKSTKVKLVSFFLLKFMQGMGTALLANLGYNLFFCT